MPILADLVLLPYQSDKCRQGLPFWWGWYDVLDLLLIFRSLLGTSRPLLALRFGPSILKSNVMCLRMISRKQYSGKTCKASYELWFSYADHFDMMSFGNQVIWNLMRTLYKLDHDSSNNINRTKEKWRTTWENQSFFYSYSPPLWKEAVARSGNQGNVLQVFDWKRGGDNSNASVWAPSSLRSERVHRLHNLFVFSSFSELMPVLGWLGARSPTFSRGYLCTISFQINEHNTPLYQNTQQLRSTFSFLLLFHPKRKMTQHQEETPLSRIWFCC